MAAIDKTYVDNWDDYKSVLEWCDEHPMPLSDGGTLNLREILYYPKLTEDDFKDGKERVLWNTSFYEDVFLIKNCDIPFIVERLRDVQYKGDYESIKDGTYPFRKRGEAGKHVKMIQCAWGTDTKRQMRSWGIYLTFDAKSEGNGYWRYYEDSDHWALSDELYEDTSEWVSSSYVSSKGRSVKAMVRMIRRWKLPVGTIVTVYGKFTNEIWKFLVTK